MELATLKTYLRIDGSEDDAILALLVEAAEGHLADAGVPKIDPSTVDADPDRVARYMGRYELAKMQFCASNYEGRTATGKQERWSLGYQSMVLQLKVEAAALLEGAS